MKDQADPCKNNLNRKENKNFYIAYSVFTAAGTAPMCNEPKRAHYLVHVVSACKDGWSFASELVDVLILEETETHYRLSFAADFAE